MPLIYNIEPAKIDFFVVQGDSVSLNLFVTAENTSTGVVMRAEAFNTPSLGSLFHMESLQLNVRRKDGLLLKEWTSVGTPSGLIINPLTDGEFDIYDIDGFLESGVFDYDCKVIDTDGLIGTIMTGSFYVKKQI